MSNVEKLRKRDLVAASLEDRHSFPGIYFFVNQQSYVSNICCQRFKYTISEKTSILKE